ncbi:MAG: hypothetical protein ABIT05_11720 [Chitinophagaceae bacterium]
MKKFISVLIRSIVIGLTMLFFTNTLIAQQTCNDEGIMKTKGSWKKKADANTFPDPDFPRTKFPEVYSRIDKMQKLLQSAYPEPLGIEASWYRSITGKAQQSGGPVPYTLTALFLAYFCNTYENKIQPGGETGTWFYIWANQLSNWFAEYVKFYIIQKQPVYLLQKRAGEIRGYPVYEGNDNQTSNTGSRYSRAIIITREKESPYIPVTQKQFLKAFLNYNEKKHIKTIEFEKNRVVKSAAEEELEKQKYLETLERITPPAKLAKAKEDFLKNYVSSAQQKQNTISMLNASHEKEMKPARLILADSLTTPLDQPAILDYNNLLEFKEFSTINTGGRELVRLNPEYYDMSLPKYNPQFLIVYWSWDDKLPTKTWRNQLEQNFNFNALKEMIDK